MEKAGKSGEGAKPCKAFTEKPDPGVSANTEN